MGNVFFVLSAILLVVVLTLGVALLFAFSTSKEALVRMALDKRESMYRKNADAGYQNDKPYRIFIGELTEEVVVPLDYKLIPISEGAGDGKR